MNKEPVQESPKKSYSLKGITNSEKDRGSGPVRTS